MITEVRGYVIDEIISCNYQKDLQITLFKEQMVEINLKDMTIMGKK